MTSLCGQLTTVSEYYLLRACLWTYEVGEDVLSRLSCRRGVGVQSSPPTQLQSYPNLDIQSSPQDQTKLSYPSNTPTHPKTRSGLGNLQKICWRAKPHEAVDAYPDKNFVLRHQEWVQPNFVLKDNVSLFSISSDGQMASFTVTSEEVDVYSSHHGPFMYITQYKLATHLVTMDITTFNTLAEELEDQDTKLIIVANTGRCGSTLLAQMFEAVQGTRVLSEPHSLLDVLNLHNRGVVEDLTYQQLVHNIMKVHIACATSKGGIQNLVFKPVFKCTPQIKLISERFPGTSTLFLFRNVKETVNSFMKVMAAFAKWAKFFTNQREMMNYWLSDLPLPLPHSTYKWARDPDMLLSLSLSAAIALNWVCTAACVRDYIKQGVNISCLDYKDLVARPEEAWEALAKFCKLPLSDDKAPLEAYKKDSQRGAFLSRGVLATSKVKKDESWMEDLEKFLAAFEMTQEVDCLPNIMGDEKGGTVLDLDND